MKPGRAGALGGGLIAAMLAAGLWVLAGLPAGARVATHFDIEGRANLYGPAWFGLPALPVIASAVWGLRVLLPRIDPRGEKLARSGRAFDTICLATTAVLAAGQVLIVGAARGAAVGVAHLLLPMLGLFFIVVGNVLGKLRWNYTVGIRTPWTLADELVWDRTHRFGGWVFVAGGVVLVIAGFAAPHAALQPVLLSVIGVVTLLPVARSYLLWRGRGRIGVPGRGLAQ
jgi:uncharacterized membrane protein